MAITRIPDNDKRPVCHNDPCEEEAAGTSEKLDEAQGNNLFTESTSINLVAWLACTDSCERLHNL